jgi:hypothetical protein
MWRRDFDSVTTSDVAPRTSDVAGNFSSVTASDVEPELQFRRTEIVGVKQNRECAEAGQRDVEPELQFRRTCCRDLC